MQNRIMPKRAAWALAAATMGLAACGSTPLEQGLVGLGAGAGVATITGGDWATGAILGAASNVAYCQLAETSNCAPVPLPR